MGIEADPFFQQDPNKVADKAKGEDKAYFKAYSWQLRDVKGVMLARSPTPRAALQTASVIYDIGKVSNGQGKLLLVYDIQGKLCATVSTKTAFRKYKASKVGDDEDNLED